MEDSVELCVALPASLVAGLDRLAQERGQRREQVLREAVDAYLRQVEAQRLTEDLHAYVDALAPYSGDFVAEQEGHPMARLLEMTQW